MGAFTYSCQQGSYGHTFQTWPKTRTYGHVLNVAEGESYSHILNAATVLTLGHILNGAIGPGLRPRLKSAAINRLVL